MTPEMIDKFLDSVSLAYPKTNPAAKADFVQLLANVPNSLFEELLQTIKKTPPGYAIGSSHIRTALDSLAPHGEILTFQTVKWICQSCKHQFFFNYQPAAGSEYLGVFNFCPQCGFIPEVNLNVEQSKVFYTGNQDKIEVLKRPRENGKSIMDYYKNKTGFWDEEKERESEKVIAETLKERRGY